MRSWVNFKLKTRLLTFLHSIQLTYLTISLLVTTKQSSLRSVTLLFSQLARENLNSIQYSRQYIFHDTDDFLTPKRMSRIFKSGEHLLSS